MTEKRFTSQRTDDYNYSDILDKGKWIGICHVDCEDDFVDKFNKLAEENKELKAFKEKVFEWIDGEMDSVKESCNVLMTSDEAEAIMDTLTELKNELSGDLE